ncbi:glycosyltransferase family 92 protein RCOM_0530710-like [Telopea speciosissima]|uniref:glycosyltransferase family 92 protein RCOM_0530710-like n=1 Tax=Telopea speciosissima TaxID=54955 RepID=UPI001CC59230|nr:glycosyltransferase family 92 protein RCOM_0530710-like [Telopea speciosissima]
MRRKNSPALLLFFLVSLALVASFLFFLPRNFFFGRELNQTSTILRNHKNLHLRLTIDTEEDIYRTFTFHHLSSSLTDLDTVSILVPDWEVLLIHLPENPSSSNAAVDDDRYYCLFQNNATSPAKPSGILPSTKATIFKCVLPDSIRRIRPFLQPILTKRRKFWPWTESESESSGGSPELLRWGFLVYESLSTEDDVILFAKGVNNRQGINRQPSELRCVFGDGVITEVTSSCQEVFRCRHPDENALARLPQGGKGKTMKISLQLLVQGREEEKEKEKVALMVPSVAYYTPSHKPASQEGKSLLCACTMVYNVAKFLKEWVLYHSKLGVDKFILYDNGSDDGLEEVVSQLLRESHNVTTFLWPWAKTQEAGFSHCAMHAKDSCTWMMYIDVDEFFFSPSWLNYSYPSTNMLRSLLPKSSTSSVSLPVGQISMRCLDFGPSNQRSNPVQGVTQGYTCRRRLEQRHKSIVLLDAIDASLLNAIHHFRLKEGYRGKWLSRNGAVVNHYKYQAWPEFKTKFRRRVSAYVADWTQEVNPKSKDRTPGLGRMPVEPTGWANKFCEVNDTGLQWVTQRWFGFKSRTGFKMAWQNQ